MVMVLVGASHHDVSLDVLEKLAQSGDQVRSRLTAESADVSGAIVLATCNRFEVYIDTAAFHQAVDLTTAIIAESSELSHDEVVSAMRVVVGTSVAQHLFSVTAGLESMVVGEDEIAGQVRQALAIAQSAGTTSPTLERLMQRALATSKAVTGSTRLGAAGRSVVSVALDIVEERYGSLSGKTALLMGTGSYARVALASLNRRECTNVHVHSSSGRAQLFAEGHDVTAVDPENLVRELSMADIVIACSGSSGPIIDQQMIRTARPTGSAVLPVLDLALTSDLAPGVAAMAEVDVVDLAVIGQSAPPEHASAILEAQDIVLDSVEQFETVEAGRSADHYVIAMRAHVMNIMNEEVERIRGRVDDETAEEVARSLMRVSNAILHTPSVRAQELARTGDLGQYREAIHTLFGIEIHSTPRD